MKIDDIVDVWRVRNPECKKYTGTWFKSKPKLQCSRIDYFLTSSCLVNKVYDCDISPGLCTDHSLIKLAINIAKSRRGHDIWKFNNLLPENEDFCTRLEGKTEFAHKDAHEI